MRATKAEEAVWAMNVVRAAAPGILDKLGPEYMPDLSQEISLLGCGAFGCVFPCRKPGMVMKITLDGTEAFLVEVLQGRKFAGLPRYLPEALCVKSPTPAWIVWRNDLPGPDLRDAKELQVDDAPDYFADPPAGMSKKEYRQMLKEQHERSIQRDWDYLYEIGQAGLNVASFMANNIHNLGYSVDRCLKILDGLMPWARSVFAPKDEITYWRYGPSESTASEYAALGLLAYEYHLNTLSKRKLVPELANTMLKLLKQGVLIGDAQADNISAGVSPYTLFDGGFTVPVSERWLSVWDDVGAKLGRWFDHDERRAAFVAWEKYT